MDTLFAVIGRTDNRVYLGEPGVKPCDVVEISDDDLMEEEGILIVDEVVHLIRV